MRCFNEQIQKHVLSVLHLLDSKLFLIYGLKMLNFELVLFVSLMTAMSKSSAFKIVQATFKLGFTCTPIHRCHIVNATVHKTVHFEHDSQKLGDRRFLQKITPPFA